jgi:hypothetical protein
MTTVEIAAGVDSYRPPNGAFVVATSNGVVLDTSALLTEAIAMYNALGYVQIDRYNDNPHAELWFEKVLV